MNTCLVLQFGTKTNSKLCQYRGDGPSFKIVVNNDLLATYHTERGVAEWEDVDLRTAVGRLMLKKGFEKTVGAGKKKYGTEDILMGSVIKFFTNGKEDEHSDDKETGGVKLVREMRL